MVNLIDQTDSHTNLLHAYYVRMGPNLHFRRHQHLVRNHRVSVPWNQSKSFIFAVGMKKLTNHRHMDVVVEQPTVDRSEDHQAWDVVRKFVAVDYWKCQNGQCWLKFLHRWHWNPKLRSLTIRSSRGIPSSDRSSSCRLYKDRVSFLNISFWNTDDWNSR